MEVIYKKQETIKKLKKSQFKKSFDNEKNNFTTGGNIDA
jgi:hypothetical protein